MDAKLIQYISKQVYSRFPEVAGKKPKVHRRSAPEPRAESQSPTYLLTYRGQAPLPGGKTLKRLVRVVADERGKILKITTSRG